MKRRPGFDGAPAGDQDGTRSPAAIVASFLSRFLEDAEAGPPRGLDHYLAAFPGHEELIRREYDQICAAEDEPADTVAPGPVRFGRYRIRSEIGRGGQGVVLLATDEQLGRPVALKVLGPGSGRDAARERQRFLREATLASRLDHPGIAHVYDAGEEDGQLYFAMRHVDGRTLAALIDLRVGSTAGDGRSLLTSAPPPLDRLDLPEIFEAAGRALHTAHERGVLHRDIKPSNLMIGRDGEPVILDFGIARDLDGQGGLTVTATSDLVGTPAYLAPEVLMTGAAAADRRADVYALGVTLYEAATGRRPFEAPTRDRLYKEILNGGYPDPRQIEPGISRDLAAVIRTAMDRDPRRRYETALAFAEDLRRLQEGRPILARPAGPLLRLVRWCARERAIATSLAAVFVVLLGSTIYSTALRQRTEQAYEAESVARRAAGDHLRQWQRLADVQVLEQLQAEEAQLWPARPGRAEAMRHWIRTARDLLARRPDHEADLAELETHAVPVGAEERERSRQEHPQWEAHGFARERIAQLEGLLSEEADPEHAKVIEAALAEARTITASIETSLATIPTMRFEDPRDEWRHQVLARLIAGLEELGRPGTGGIARMERRLATAMDLRRRTLEEPAEAWSAAIDRVALGRIYRGLEIEPQLGLIPLGPDPDSGLEEFAETETGTPPVRDPATGRLAIGEDSAMVFVLLPGGSFLMGFQNEDPRAPNFDPELVPVTGSPVHEVRLDPFFLAKHEMTQGQWLRLMGTNPSAYDPGSRFGDTPVVDLRHPVEQVSWKEAVQALARIGALLPTEAQWEFACRAGTSTIWWTGDDPASLEGAANLADESCRVNGGPTGVAYVSWDDGYPVHAPVGSFRANRFGLHDLAGNAGEWCGDMMGSYHWPVREGDGLRKVVTEGEGYRVQRGGDFHTGLHFGRSGRRNAARPTARLDKFGLRAARPLQR